MAVVVLIRNERTVSELADLLGLGRVDEALEIVERAAGRLGVAWNDSYVGAGQNTAEFLTRRVEGVLVNFDRVNFRAVAAMRENSLRLVREFGLEQRLATNQVLVDGIQEGLNPQAMARAFRDSIGLTHRQIRQVASYRRQLRDLDRTALRRELRDRRFDSTVDRAIRTRTPLTEARIERLVARYRERLLAHRARVIAETEALSVVHAGVTAMYQQAIESRDLDADQIIRVWHTRGDERVRSSHSRMDGQERALEIPFTSGNGFSLRHPGDFQAPASERIKCRCGVSTRIESVAELAPTATLIEI